MNTEEIHPCGKKMIAVFNCNQNAAITVQEGDKIYEKLFGEENRFKAAVQGWNKICSKSRRGRHDVGLGGCIETVDKTQVQTKLPQTRGHRICHSKIKGKGQCKQYWITQKYWDSLSSEVKGAYDEPKVSLPAAKRQKVEKTVEQPENSRPETPRKQPSTLPPFSDLVLQELPLPDLDIPKPPTTEALVTKTLPQFAAEVPDPLEKTVNDPLLTDKPSIDLPKSPIPPPGIPPTKSFDESLNELFAGIGIPPATGQSNTDCAPSQTTEQKNMADTVPQSMNSQMPLFPTFYVSPMMNMMFCPVQHIGGTMMMPVQFYNNSFNNI